MNEIVDAGYSRLPLADVLRHQDEPPVPALTIFAILWRRKISIAVCGLVLSAIAIALIARMGETYVSTAAVLVQERKSSVLDIQLAGPMATDSVAVRTQADLLRSADLARSVVSDLKLTEVPEFSPAGPNPLLAKVAEFMRDAGLGNLFNMLGLSKPTANITETERLELATRTLLGVTTINNDGRSYVIEIRVKLVARAAADRDRIAALTATIANDYAAIYTQFTGRVKADEIRHAFGFFDERVADLQAKVARAEHSVEDYRLANGLIDNRSAATTGRPVTVANQQLTQLNADLVTATADRVAKEASLDAVSVARTGHGSLLSVPEVIASPVIARLREQQAELGAKQAALAASHGAASPEIMAVAAAQRDVAQQLDQQAAKIAASLQAGVDAVRLREATLRRQLAQVGEQVGSEGIKAIKLRELENEAEAARSVLSTYLQKVSEMSEQLDMMEPDALLVSRAGKPLSTAPPSKKQLSMFAVVAAFAVAAVLVLIQERTKSGFRTAAELNAATSAETLGYIPKVRRLAKALTFENSSTAFSVAILSIRALIRLNTASSARVIMVTSAAMREGKTFVAAALSRNAALAGERVILVDCSTRRPAVTSAINASPPRLMDGISVQKDTVTPLEILTLRSETCSPPDLFASEQMRSLIRALRARYDLIVFDAPPVLPVSDARVLATLCDGVLLVVGWRSTPPIAVQRALSALRASGVDVVGMVLNKVNSRHLSAVESLMSCGLERV